MGPAAKAAKILIFFFFKYCKVEDWLNNNFKIFLSSNIFSNILFSDIFEDLLNDNFEICKVHTSQPASQPDQWFQRSMYFRRRELTSKSLKRKSGDEGFGNSFSTSYPTSADAGEFELEILQS